MKQGSCCLAVIMAMALIGAVYFAYCHSTNFFVRYVQASIKSATHEELTKGVLNYGIAYAAKNFDQMAKNDTVMHEQFLFDQQGAHLEWRPNKESVEIIAVLSSQGQEVCGMTCRVNKNEEQKLIIRGFQRRTISLY